MKALTLWRPWPWAIFHAPPATAKRIENRPWKPWPSIIGQRLVLHAGKTFDREAVDDVVAAAELGTSIIPAEAADEGLIGLVTVTGYLEAPPDGIQARWWSGPYAWVLTDVVTFAEPIPCKGMQGLWELPGWALRKVLTAAVIEAER